MADEESVIDPPPAGETEAATETTAAEGEKETTTSAETGENDSPPVLHEEIPTNTSEEGQVEDTREQSSAGAIIEATPIEDEGVGDKGGTSTPGEMHVSPDEQGEGAAQENDTEKDEQDESVLAVEAGAQEAEQPDDNVEEANYTIDSMHSKYDAIIEEEDELGPDIEIATQELPEEDTFIDGGGAFDGREFPDAYATPPPEGAQDGGFQDYYDENKEDSEYSQDYPVFDRAQLLERYKEVREERSHLQNLNNQLQHKLAEYFKKKKTDERAQEIEKSVTDQEQRYLKYISNLQELQLDEKRQLEEIKAQKEDMKQRCLEKRDKVTTVSEEYLKFKYEIAKTAINSRSGKSIPQKDLDVSEALELKKEQEVRQVRLDNIKLKNRLRKKEQLLKAKEELAEGLHLIDFEQLKIENQTYNEKIEERNEEILKLRKKITTTVQVLTHLKEKLQFVQGENTEQRNRLKNIDATVAQKRDVLTRTKQVRDAMRIDNLKLKQKCGLLGSESLLRDFEVRKDEGDDLAQKLTDLRVDHTKLSMNLNGVKKKIRQARNNSA